MPRAWPRWMARRAQRPASLPPPAAAEPPAPARPSATMLLDAFEEPLLLLDGTTVIHANAAARALLGDYVDGEDLRLAIRQPDAAALIGGRGEGSALISGLGGHERRWEISVRAIADGSRLVRLTDRSAAHAAERMRTDFVANASHELRTPLAALIGFIETLDEANGPDDSAVRARFLAIMAGEARRMQRLIDDLMSLSRIEADRFVTPRERIDLTRLVRAACAEIEAGGKTSGRIALAAEGGQAAVLGDRAQLSQLVHNIVGNALKYARDGTPVHVTLGAGDGTVRLTVADEGDGIPAEHLPRLTERFYRVDPGRSRALGGTGLGLAIVKHIVERHRGSLEIASTVGVGTTVTVTLPLAAPPAEG